MAWQGRDEDAFVEPARQFIFAPAQVRGQPAARNQKQHRLAAIGRFVQRKQVLLSLRVDPEFLDWLRPRVADSDVAQLDPYRDSTLGAEIAGQVCRTRAAVQYASGAIEREDLGALNSKIECDVDARRHDVGDAPVANVDDALSGADDPAYSRPRNDIDAVRKLTFRPSENMMRVGGPGQGETLAMDFELGSRVHAIRIALELAGVMFTDDGGVKLAKGWPR
jgi:hypothetical protein